MIHNNKKYLDLLFLINSCLLRISVKIEIGYPILCLFNQRTVFLTMYLHQQEQVQSEAQDYPNDLLTDDAAGIKETCKIFLPRKTSGSVMVAARRASA